MLASCYAASAADVELLGTRAGQRTTKLVRPVRVVQGASTRAHANVEGVDVHAEVALDGRDRARLERLIRYVTRPPLAIERLEEHDGGRLRYRFKKAWKDGTHAVVLDPLDLIARLAAIVPPPRWHLVRYHGVLAANATERAEIVPARAPATPPRTRPAATSATAPRLKAKKNETPPGTPKTSHSCRYAASAW